MKDKVIDAEGFRLLFEEAPSALLVVAAEDGQILRANKKATRLLGFSHEELEGSSARKYLEDMQVFNGILQAQEEDDSTLEWRSKSGGIVRTKCQTSSYDVDGHCVVQMLLSTIKPKNYTREKVIKNKISTDVKHKPKEAQIDSVKSIKLLYSGFVMRAALKDLLANQKIDVSFYGYPQDIDSFYETIEEDDFLIFALPGLSENDIAEINDIRKSRMDLPMLVMTLSADEKKVHSLIQAGVRGVISNEKEFHLLPTAVNAISNDELWCPRSILQQVFENYLDNGSSQSDKSPAGKALSTRELDILKFIVKGYKNKEIAKTLGISYSTVINHTYNLYRKLEVNNRAGAIRYAINNRMIVV